MVLTIGESREIDVRKLLWLTDGSKDSKFNIWAVPCETSLPSYSLPEMS